MERLTYDFCIGSNHCWQIKGADNFMCKEVCIKQEDDGCTNCPIKKAFDRLAAYENTGLEPGEILTGKEMVEVGCVIIRLKKYEDIGPIDHLRELAQAEKDGRLVVLPCNMHDPLYIINNGEIHRNYGCQWHFTGKECQTFGTLSMYGEVVGLDDFGKTVFLTREEAEEALKKREEEDDETVR
jgi:hypothetical protein